MAVLYSNLDTMSTQLMEKLYNIWWSIYSDLALGYYISGPKLTIITEWCPACSFFLDDFDNLWITQEFILIF